jgi:hypothetical protein
MSETNGNGSNGNGNQWRLVAVSAATLLMGGGVGATLPRGDDTRVAVLEVKLDVMGAELKDLKGEVRDLKTAVLGAFPAANTKEKLR